VGEGDIVDTNNSGYGCTFEQFQARDTACTENEVRGDYFVNYRAEPRPGWRYVRWDGPCSPRSDFQHCRHDIPAEGVTWWDKTYPDTDIPPSTAIFEPITGETGFLVGPAIAGIAYETPSQKGVTGLDGSFQYGEGETVRFTIGDTLLGGIKGQAQVTLFDLAGSPLLTGLNITWALEDETLEEETLEGDPNPGNTFNDMSAGVNPFHAVINLAVLLQSLDHDANPENGVGIRQGVVTLFRGVSLDVRQRWESFHGDSKLHRAMGQANRQQRFSQAHGIVHPGDAIDQLYGILEIDPGTVGVTLLRNGDGIPAYTERFRYDADGNMTRHDDGTPDAFETWLYNTNGFVNRHERDAEKYVGHDIETWNYDANSNVIRQGWDYDADGTTEEFKTWQYNTDGNVTRYEYDARQHAGYGYHQIELWNYDNKGNLIYNAWDHDADGTPDFTSTWKYDVGGKLTQSTASFDGESSSQTWLYDNDGNLIQRVEESEGGRYGGGIVIETWQYDARGNLIRRELFHEGTREQVETWQYDDNSNVIRRELFHEGTQEQLETWQYDDNGSKTRYDCEGSCSVGRFLPAHYRNDSWQYHGNGNVMSHEIEATSEIAGSWLYHYDINGNLTRYVEHGFDFEGNGSNIIESWQYDARSNLLRAEEDSDADGKPDHIQTWQYNVNGNLTRTAEDEDGDGMIDGVTTYQYEATGWGHLFSTSKAWRHPSSPPLKPRPYPGYLD